MTDRMRRKYAGHIAQGGFDEGDAGDTELAPADAIVDGYGPLLHPRQGIGEALLPAAAFLFAAVVVGFSHPSPARCRCPSECLSEPILSSTYRANESTLHLSALNISSPPVLLAAVLDQVHRGLLGASPASPAVPTGPGGAVAWAFTTLGTFLFAYHAISVRVAHVLISGVPAVDWCDAVGPGFRARDTAVTVVVPQGQGVHFGGRSGGCRSSPSRCGSCSS